MTSVRVSDEWLKKLEAAGFPMEELCLGVAEEILRRLPGVLFLSDKDKRGFPTFSYYPTLSPKHFTVGYMGERNVWITHDGKMVYFEESTLANAAAAMYCLLSENKLLPPL